MAHSIPYVWGSGKEEEESNISSDQEDGQPLEDMIIIVVLFV